MRNRKDKKVKVKSEQPDDNDFSYQEPKMTPKWYEEIKNVVTSDSSADIKNEELDKLRKEAANAYESDIVTKSDKPPKSISNSDYLWIKTVMSKGTVSDKIAAYSLLIQDSPLQNLNLLRNMVGMVKVGKKNECHLAIDALLELFLNDVLPPDRKLKLFIQQPLLQLDKITSGNIKTRKRHLILWHFEDKLKSIYRDFVAALNVAAQDSVEANKVKVISAMYKLLAGHPEQESALLTYIVNKLGDPNHKVGSKVIYTLTKLLEIHPNMREVVMDEVEKVIFRSNISKRAQYYSICFLTQFCLGGGDSKIANKLMSIYLALFKACVKTGEVDSRLMSALLTGVNRAYPYTENDAAILSDHINTMYKVVHISTPIVATQALSLLHLMSKRSNNFSDRYYMVLYKKIGDPMLFSSTHQAMFLSLIFKSLKQDKNLNRVVIFVKRLLQMCHYLQVPVISGILFIISEVIKNKKEVIKLTLEADVESAFKKEYIDDEDDGEEHYEDVKLGDSTAPENPPEEHPPSVITPEEPKPVYNIQDDLDETKPPLKVWVNKDRTFDSSNSEYDPYHRNPLHSGGKKTAYTELLNLRKHFHPTVSLFAGKILNGEEITYSGDPLQDFSLMRFLDKFSFKNPKVLKKEEKETPQTFSVFGRKKNYTIEGIRRLRVNTEEYINLEEKSVPPEEKFLYKYMKHKAEKDEEMRKIKEEKEDKKQEEEEDVSDVESVTSVEFDEVVRKALGVSMKDDIDFLTEAGKLPKKSKKKDKKKEESESEEEPEFEADEEFEEEEDGGDAELGDDDMDDFSDIDDFSDPDDSDLDTTELSAKLDKMGFPDKSKKKQKQKKENIKKKFSKDNWFASAEEFSELLEQSDKNAGGSEAMSNKDNASMKQIKWETDRDKWIKNKNYRNKSNKRKKFGTFNKGNKKRKTN